MLRAHLGNALLVLVLVAGLPGALWSQEPTPTPPVPDTPPPGSNPPAPPAASPPILFGSDFIRQEALDAPAPVPPREPAFIEPPSRFEAPGGLASFMGPGVGHMLFRADYRATWYPAEPVTGQPTNLGYLQQDFSVACPVWQDACNEWSVSAHVRAETFDTNAILPDSHRPFPDDLWNVRFGTTYRHQFGNDWIAGGTVSFGSASNEPFHSINELTAGVNAFLRVPQGEHNAWLFTLNYSVNSELPFPIPGVAFFWAPTEQFHALIGLPLQIWWRPVDDLTFDISYMLIHNVRARATYRLCGPVRIYFGYEWNNESYFLTDRPDDRDRFFYYDQRLVAGVQAALDRHWSFDLSSGYVFDRHYFQGQSYNHNGFDRIDVGDGPFLSGQVHVRW
jgi:hypothetical protein